MKGTTTMILLLAVLLVLTGCDTVDVSKVSNDDIKRIADNVIVCDTPYIRHGADCCLDKDSNSVCDKDEQKGVVSDSETTSPLRPDEPVGSIDSAPTPYDNIFVEESNHSMDDGEPTQKVVFVAFVDYEEPWSRRFHAEIEPRLIKDYVETGKMRYSVRHFPFTIISPYAQTAAEASECAGQQYAFWEMHDALMVKPESDSPQDYSDDVKQLARDLGLDDRQFSRCLDNGETRAQVEQDVEDIQAAGGQGVPSFVINGKIAIVGVRPYEEFQTAIEAKVR